MMIDDDALLLRRQWSKVPLVALETLLGLLVLKLKLFNLVEKVIVQNGHFRPHFLIRPIQFPHTILHLRILQFDVGQKRIE